MKILSLTDFMKCVPGTIYQQIDGDYVEPNFWVKLSNCGEADFATFDISAYIKEFEDRNFTHIALAFENGCGRWGLFDDNYKFIVYDEQDIENLCYLLKFPLEYLNKNMGIAGVPFNGF